MRIAVVGVGAVGGALAALLDRAGHHITAVVRKHSATAAVLASPGLRLTGARGDHLAQLAIAQQVPSDAELVIVAVRSYQTTDALTPLATVLGEQAALASVPVVVVQNGLAGPTRAASALGRPQGSGVFGALALFAATLAAPGQVTLTGNGGIRLAPVRPHDYDDAVNIAQVLGDAFETMPLPDLRSALWSKLLVNHVNALPAITGHSVQFTCRQPATAALLAASLTESVAVADALGVRFVDLGVLKPAHIRMIRNGEALSVVRSRLGHAFGVRPNPASTLQSIRRHEPTEIDDLNGAVVRAARQARIPTPINEALVSLVHQVSETGHFLSIAELQRRVEQHCQLARTARLT